MSKFAVRQAGPGDEHALTALDALCFPDPWSVESYAREMHDNPFAIYIIAETEDVLVPQEPWENGTESAAENGSNGAAGNGTEMESATDLPITATGTGLLGYVGIWLVADEGHITNVAVHPAHRGQGIGKVLLKLLIDYCETNLCFDLTLEVRPGNEAALRLYKGFDFKEEGRRPKYYEDGEDALLLWRHGSLPEVD